MSAAEAAEMLEKRARETKEIISRVSEWAGGDEEAMVWYRTQPLPALGGRTAEMLVSSGQSAAVRDYLEGIAIGGFA
jgi:hypothetical protein